MLKEYEVTLSGETWYLLAEDSMQAAYSALELSEDRNTKLINVRIKDEWWSEQRKEETSEEVLLPK